MSCSPTHGEATMTHLPRLLLVLSVFLAFGCQDGIVQPDVDPLLDHKNRHGKPGDGGGEDPPTVGPDGIVHVFVGGRLDGVINSLEGVGAVRAGFLGVRPVGSVVQGSAVMNAGYLSEPGVVTNGDACFQFPNNFVSGTLSLTETADELASL